MKYNNLKSIYCHYSQENNVIVSGDVKTDMPSIILETAACFHLTHVEDKPFCRFQEI